MDSVEAKVNQLTATWQQFVTNLQVDDEYKTVIDVAIKAVDLLDFLINKCNALSGVIASGLIAGITKLLTTSIKTTNSMAGIGAIIQNIADIGEEDANALGSAITGLTTQQKLLVLSTKNLNATQTKAALMATKMGEAEAEAAVASTGLATAQAANALSTDGAASSFQKFWTALKTMAATNAPLLALTAITAVVSGLVTAVKKEQQAEQEAIETAQNAVTAREQETSELQDYIDKIKELKNSLKDESLTRNEEKEIKSELSSLETELVKKYGAEAKSIDLVNGNLEEQLTLLENINKIKAAQYVNENTSAYYTARNNMKSYITSGAMQTDYTIGEIPSNIDSSQLEAVLAKYQDKGVYVQENDPDKLSNIITGNQYTKTIKFVGNAEDAEETLTALYNDLEKLQDESGNYTYNNTVDSIKSGVLGGIDVADEIISTNQGIVDEYISNKIASNDKLSDQFGELEKAVQAYNDAIASGDATKIEKQASYYEHVKEVTEGLSNKIFPDATKKIDEMDSAIDRDTASMYLWLNNLKGQAYQYMAALKESGVTASDIATFTDENTSKEAEYYRQLIALANEYGVSESTLVDWMEKKNILLDDTANNIESLSSEIDDYITQIEDLENGYTVLETAVDEFNSNGMVSVSTLKKLLKLDEDYLDCLYVENGQIKINSDSILDQTKNILDNIEAKIEEKKNTLLTAKANAITTYSTYGLSTAELELATSIATISGESDEYVSALDSMKAKNQELINQIANSNITEELANSSYMKQLDNLIAGYDSEIDLLENMKKNLSTELFSSANSTSSTDAWKAAFEDEYNELQYQRDMDIIDEKKYYEQLIALNEKYFANREKYLDEFVKYNKEAYNGLKDLEEDRLKKEAKAEIKSIEDKIDALKDQKEALQDNNDEEERALKLKKAQDRYEAAKSQRNTRVYTNEQGWVWTTDPEEVADAKEELDDIEKEIAEKAAEKAIDDQIDELEKLKDTWEDYIDNIDVKVSDLGYNIEDIGDIATSSSSTASSATSSYTGYVNKAKDAVSDLNDELEDTGKIVEGYQNIIVDKDFKALFSGYTGIATVATSTKNPETSTDLSIDNNLKSNESAEYEYVTNSNGEKIKTKKGSAFASTQQTSTQQTGITTEVDNSIYSAQQSIGKIQSILQSVAEINLSNIFTNCKSTIDEITTALQALEQELLAYRNSTSNTRLQSDTDFTSMTTKVLDHKQAMLDLGEATVATLTNVQNSLDGLDSEQLTPIMSNISGYIQTISSSFLNLAELIRLHIQDVESAATSDEKNFERMSKASKSFASTMASVKTIVFNALHDIKTAAQEAVTACEEAEDAAERAGAAAQDAAESAKSAKESASEAKKYADKASSSKDDDDDDDDKSTSSDSKTTSNTTTSTVKATTTTAKAKSTNYQTITMNKQTKSLFSGYANGIENGAVDFTGLAMLHGTPSSPEYVLNSKQMENFVRNMSRTSASYINSGRDNVSSNDTNFNNCTFPLNNVKDANDFIPALKQIAKQNRR
jgi:DNA repair exonuclease SbcCD ATPase subunit